jgi:hypothetical protein
MAGHELAYGGGKWHGEVDAEMKKLRSEGILFSEELDENAFAFLQTLPYVETLMVLKTMHSKPAEEDTCAWIVKKCKAMRQKFGTLKEKKDYAAAELLIKCSEKAAKVSKKKSLKDSEFRQKVSGGAASKKKASGGAASKKKAAKASGGAAPERPSERFSYEPAHDGSRIKVFEPTTKDDPVVISD